jgi:hypothetical protein
MSNSPATDLYDEEAQQEKSLGQQFYEYVTNGTPIDLGGGGVDPTTGEIVSNSNSGTTGSSGGGGSTTTASTGLTEAQVQGLIGEALSKEDPIGSLGTWLDDNFPADGARLSPETMAQIHYINGLMLGKPQYSELTNDNAEQHGFEFNSDEGVWVFRESGNDGEPAYLVDGGDGNLVRAEWDADSESYIKDEDAQPYKVLTKYGDPDDPSSQGILMKGYNLSDELLNSTMNHLFGTPNADGVREGGALTQINQVAQGTIYNKTDTQVVNADGTLADGYVRGTDGTITGPDGQEVRVSDDGYALEESSVYDRVEGVVTNLLGPGGALELAQGDVSNIRDLAGAIEGIGDRFGAYTQNEDGSITYNPDSFEARYGAYENQMGGITQEYSDVINRLVPYEQRALGLAEDYDALGGEFDELYTESRDPNAYSGWQDLLYADSRDQINRGAVGARDTLNSTYANAGVDPNSPAYTAALMELEKSRGEQLTSARRQAALDAFNMGSQSLSNSANLLGGVERSLAGKGMAYGMGINTLMSQGNLISNKANSILSSVGLLNQQAGAATQQAGLYGQAAGLSSTAAGQQLNVGNAGLNYANAGVANTGNQLQNLGSAAQPWITMSPMIQNWGQGYINNIQGLVNNNAQMTGEFDVTNAINAVDSSD